MYTRFIVYGSESPFIHLGLHMYKKTQNVCPNNTMWTKDVSVATLTAQETNK